MPPALFPSAPLDTIDQQYLDNQFAPVVNPLKGALKVQLYNDKWLHSARYPVQTKSLITDLPSSEIDSLAFQPHPIPNSASRSHHTSITHKPNTQPIPITPSPIPFHDAIKNSKDKLCFVMYTPIGTMLRKWYLVRICLQSSIASNFDATISGLYYCDFLAKHKDDVRRSDELSRWWPDWYRYTIDKLTGDIVFGSRILLRPNITPDHNKYIQWADTLNLFDSDTLLYGPFNFLPISSSNRSRNLVAPSDWLRLGAACGRLSILPPTLVPPKRFTVCPPTRHHPSTKRKRRVPTL